MNDAKIQTGDRDTQAPSLAAQSNEDASQPAKSRFEKFASTQAAGDGIQGDTLKPHKTTDEKIGANMADRK
ncbi:MAG: hypothetical protein M3N91_07345 [Pseudomonadota bacterium]|nr:hypothetical protein [Pseudomonadota bacterium]